MLALSMYAAVTLPVVLFIVRYGQLTANTVTLQLANLVDEKFAV